MKPRAQRHFTAGLFDFDGTLADTEPLHEDAETRAITALGANPLVPNRPRVFGMGDERGLRVVARFFDLEFAPLLEMYRLLWAENVRRGIRFIPGAERRQQRERNE